MEIKQLKTFICIAETGSLSAASDRLRLAQPALSRQIKLLEHELGIQLFKRHARGMTLTETGEKFISRISGLIHQLEQSADDIRSLQGDIKGTVSIGLMPMVNNVLAVRLIERVKCELPHVTLRLIEGASGHLIEWLQKGDLDCSFLNGPGNDLHLRCRELLCEEIGFVSAPNTLPDLGAKIEISDISHLPLAMTNHPHAVRSILDKITVQTGVSLNVSIRSNSFSVLKSLIASGDYHSFIPLPAIATELQDGTLEARTFTSSSIRRHLVLALPPDRTTTRATDAVMDILCSEIATMIDEGAWQAIPASELVQFSKGNSPPKPLP